LPSSPEKRDVIAWGTEDRKNAKKGNVDQEARGSARRAHRGPSCDPTSRVWRVGRSAAMTAADSPGRAQQVIEHRRIVQWRAEVAPHPREKQVTRDDPGRRKKNRKGEEGEKRKKGEGQKKKEPKAPRAKPSDRGDGRGKAPHRGKGEASLDERADRSRLLKRRVDECRRRSRIGQCPGC